MDCIKCHKELTEYEEHGFWNINPYAKLCIHCLLKKALPEERTKLKMKIQKSLEKWKVRKIKY